MISISFFVLFDLFNELFCVKNQACEVPASQNEQSHYTCDDNGDVKCLPGKIQPLIRFVADSLIN